MRDDKIVDIIAFLLSCFLLFAIIMATQVKPNTYAPQYKVISVSENGMTYYMYDINTKIIYYVNASGDISVVHNADGSIRLYE